MAKKATTGLGYPGAPGIATPAFSTLERTDRYLALGGHVFLYCPENKVGAYYSIDDREWTMVSPIGLTQFITRVQKAGIKLARSPQFSTWKMVCGEPPSDPDPTPEQLQAAFDAVRNRR